MSNEKYIVEIGEEGSKGLEKLDYCFNPTTQDFLLKSGLKQAKMILEIGCGSGVMSCWMAQQVGNDAKVTAIENDVNQLNAAKRNAEKLGIRNIEFQLCSAYDLETLNQSFDFVYCRFVLHHLHDPIEVIKKIYRVLAKGGVYAAEEGIVNFAFSYPFSKAWGDESARLNPIWVDPPENQRDGNIGVKMYTKMRRVGFQILDAKIVHPLLVTSDEKKLLLLGMEELKRSYLEQGHEEAEWETLMKSTEDMVNNDEQFIGFYGSCQVAGKRNDVNP